MRDKYGLFIEKHPMSNTGRTCFKKGHTPWNKGNKNKTTNNQNLINHLAEEGFKKRCNCKKNNKTEQEYRQLLLHQEVYFGLRNK